MSEKISTFGPPASGFPPKVRSRAAGYMLGYFSIFFVDATRSVFVPSTNVSYASIDPPADDTKTMKVFISTKKTEKYLHICNFCSTFARFLIRGEKTD